ncbi:hypothetical protein CQW23_05459 [Capsicum baccatum]|uniref:MCAfunc domain-containing protein n=1 Tax=Capsicum baccatum TaxID=33114 RepID=A0A2G2XHJ3_CAPBA|nr:hypothetical protein CQW23_05459 [Capsicum baccatum]
MLLIGGSRKLEQFRSHLRPDCITVTCGNGVIATVLEMIPMLSAYKIERQAAGLQLKGGGPEIGMMMNVIELEIMTSNLIGNLLEQLKITELKRYPETREPLEHLEDALRRNAISLRGPEVSMLQILQHLPNKRQIEGWNVNSRSGFYVKTIPHPKWMEWEDIELFKAKLAKETLEGERVLIRSCF